MIQLVKPRWFGLHRVRVVVLLSMFLACSTYGVADDDVLVIEGVRIKGNQESPTILYVVPWQSPEIAELDSTASVPELELSIQPLERSEFVRLVDYHQHFKALHVQEVTPE